MSSSPDINSDIKLGIFDINGTIHTKQHGVSEAVILGFDSLHRKGIETSVVTGRTYSRARELLAGRNWLRIISPGVSLSVENGARLVRQDGRTLNQQTLPAQDVGAVIDAIDATRDSISYLAYAPKAKTAPSIVWLPPSGDLDAYLGANEANPAIITEHLSGLARRIVAEQACMIRLGIKLSSSAGQCLDGLNVLTNQAELNIMAEGVSKASGVEAIAGYTNTAMPEVLVAGDDFNDLSMIDLTQLAQRYFVGDNLNPDYALSVPVTRVANPDALGRSLAGI